MNPEQPDHVQRMLADLDARLGRITAEVAEVRSGLAALGRQTRPVQPTQPVPPGQPTQPVPPGQPTQPVPPTQSVPPGHPAQPAPGATHPDPRPAYAQHSGPGRDSVWRAGAPQAGGPALGGYRPAGPVDGPRAQPGPGPAGPAAPGPAGPGWTRRSAETRSRRVPRLTAATVIAAIGGSVMLAGIAFLLVVAIQAGLFPPIARVVAAAVLALVLVGLGLWLQSRHEATPERPINPGALALVGTGLAAAMLDVIACTTLYQWIPVPAAYMFVGGLALAGMALAQRWSSGLLACLVSAGTMVLAPFISTGVELPVFLVILAIATAVLGAELGIAVRVVWSVFPAPVLVGYLTQTHLHDRGEQVALIVAALVFAAVGVGVAWVDSVRRRPAPENAALVVVPTAVPLLLLSGLFLLRPGWPVGVILAAAYLTVAVVAGRRAHEPGPVLLSAVSGVVGSALLFGAWVELGGREMTSLALTLSATGYVVAAGLWGRRWADWVAGVGAAIALAVYLVVNEPFLALDESLAVRELTYWDVVAALAVTALAVAATWWASRRVPRQASRVVMAGAVAALLAFSVMVVAAGVVIGDLAGAARNGFLVAHLVVTVLWISCAAWLILTPSPRLSDARRMGFVLGSLALAKLLFLDLATLPGLFRVLSFIAVGAVMLAVAVRYRGGTDGGGTQGGGTRGGGTDVGGVQGGGTGENGTDGRGGPYYRRDTEPSGSGSPT
ncbi:DUF2339 domain-containing protein [Dietzia natronolimnaea]|uniref:DUF2339 domain-containing protein n=3 Tax=Dietzia TaxID=37914 RepID=UPI0031F9E1D5